MVREKIKKSFAYDNELDKNEFIMAYNDRNYEETV